MAVLIKKKEPESPLQHSEGQLRSALEDLGSALYGRDKACELVAACDLIEDLRERVRFMKGLCTDLVKAGQDELELTTLVEASTVKFEPVPIREFLEDPYYLGLREELYPIVADELEEANSGKYVEAVYTGGIGSAKTTQALWTQAYQVYLLSSIVNPQKTFGIAKTDEILIIFQSLNASKAKALNYGRFRALIERSPYFKEEFPFDKDIESELRFPHRIIVRPVSGASTATIGENVIGGLIDEVNFMAMVEDSKMSDDGGLYDQAQALYNSISKRRKSRFMLKGKQAGILCLVSSKRYPGQFTDIKQKEAEDDPTIYVFDKRVWDVKPESVTGEWFDVFVGDDSHKPRILEEGEEVDEDLRHLVDRIPEEYRKDFERDMMTSLRDIAGVSTIAKHPFLSNVELVVASFKKNQKSILSSEWTDFDKHKLQIYPKRFYKPDLPRWVHIDLAITGDSAGVTMGTVDKFMSIDRGDVSQEILPHFHIDFQLEVKPPKGGEIIFGKIRTLLYKLREYGMNIKWVSYDSFQSRDSMQILRQMNFMTGYVSMDVSTMPYDFTKNAIYDGRVSQPVHNHLKGELVGLELDTKKGKVDHPPTGSKDVADSLAGVISGLTMRREIWSMHDVAITQLPESIQTLIVKENMKGAGETDTDGQQDISVG